MISLSLFFLTDLTFHEAIFNYSCTSILNRLSFFMPGRVPLNPSISQAGRLSWRVILVFYQPIRTTPILGGLVCLFSLASLLWSVRPAIARKYYIWRLLSIDETIFKTGTNSIFVGGKKLSGNSVMKITSYQKNNN